MTPGGDRLIVYCNKNDGRGNVLVVFDAGSCAELTKRGLIFNDVDQAPFRGQLSGFYKTWKGRLGSKAWSLLETAAGTTLA